MTSLTRLRDLVDVVVGVDTHVKTHTAAIIDAKTGGVIDDVTVSATAAGYQQLIDFADEHSESRVWAIEGTSSHGCGLTRLLHSRQELIVELDRPKREKRRNGVKSDRADAIRAGREALSRDRLGTPRGTGDRQALAVLVAARRTAVDAAGDAGRQILGLLIAAPEPLRARFAGLTSKAIIAAAGKLRDQPGADTETRRTITVLRLLARRHHTLTAEAAEQHRAIHTLVTAWRPDLLSQPGIGPISAAALLCAWSHPGRIHNEAAFAMLAGAAPIPASSGDTIRYRLNRFGDRRLNRALHTIVITRMRHHQPTRDYVARRTTDGKTRKEIKRCLKRYLARDLFRQLENPPQPEPAAPRP
jgi:transposase